LTGSAIEIDRVSQTFSARGRTTRALEEVSFRIEPGEFVALVGPSGCGKSTLLNMVAGIIPVLEGEIRHGGRALRGINTGVGYLTQADSILPWRSAEENVMLPLLIRGDGKRAARERARELLGQVNLTGFANAFPNELSGGMRKRVALAQVLAYDPDTLLMDEPFGALDAQLRLVMQDELTRLWEEAGKTILFVTHDIGEAVALADRVLVFSGRPGRIKAVERVAIDRPRDIFRIRFDKRYEASSERIWEELSPEIRKGEAM
jgi:NitT/TauT family transport system ATP-binding protein